MLTAAQIRSYTFRSAGKGLYRSEDVDTFKTEVVAFIEKINDLFLKKQQNAEKAARENEELHKMNDDLYQRVEALANALNQLRAERDLIQKTLIHARNAADDLTGQARGESETLLREAKEEAARLLRAAQEEAARMRPLTALRPGSALFTTIMPMPPSA